MANNYFELLSLEDIINYLHAAAEKVIKDKNIEDVPTFKLSVHYADDMGYDISCVELNSKSDNENSFGLNASNKGIWYYSYNVYDNSIREYVDLFTYESLTF